MATPLTSFSLSVEPIGFFFRRRAEIQRWAEIHFPQLRQFLEVKKKRKTESSSRHYFGIYIFDSTYLSKSPFLRTRNTRNNGTDGIRCHLLPYIPTFRVFRGLKRNWGIKYIIPITFARILRKLSLDDLQAAFVQFVNGILDDSPMAAAVDGKAAKQMTDENGYSGRGSEHWAKSAKKRSPTLPTSPNDSDLKQKLVSGVGERCKFGTANKLPLLCVVTKSVGCCFSLFPKTGIYHVVWDDNEYYNHTWETCLAKMPKIMKFK